MKNKILKKCLIACLVCGGMEFFFESALADQVQAQSSNGYILKSKNKMDSVELKTFFSKHKILQLKQLNTNLFLLRFAKDPGLKILQEEIKSSDKIESIQPNFRYHSTN